MADNGGIAAFIKKLRKLTLVKLVKKIPNERIKNYILPRLYYYFNIKPHILMLDTSSKCNSACPFCPRTLENIRGVNMTREVFYKTVDEAYALGIRECRLYSTGEPLLHPNIDEFIRYMKQKGFYLIVSTNGQFLDKHFEALSLADEVKVSIEGWDKESYEYYRKNCDFEKVQKNMADFKQYLTGRKPRPIFSAACMVMRETNMDAYYKAWRDKVDRVIIYPTSYVFDWDKKDKIEFLSFDKYDRLKKNMYDYVYDQESSKYCGYHFEVVLVTAQGNGVICCSDFTDSITYGNLKDVSLLDVINHPKRKAGQKQYVTQKLDVCDGCTEYYKLDKNSQEEYDEKIATYA